MNCKEEENERKQKWVDQLLAGVVLYGSLDKALTQYMIKEERKFSLDKKEWLYISN
ncbi:hypothetical protein [Bacillus sp. REN10]|uniref:hypothetical protein n=1 Tax=Bacillus sp. REN10 TaxID=2782541 RepID=UPI00193B327C|nr:hypothetical protein [Bacillus sp. REN10]